MHLRTRVGVLTAAVLAVTVGAAAVAWFVLRPAAPHRPGDRADGCGRVSAELVPSCGAWWGVYEPPDGAAGRGPGAAVAELERRVGRTFDLVRRYHDFSDSGGNGAFPDDAERAQLRAGRLVYLGWESRIFSTGAVLRWRAVADGRYDRVVDHVAERIKAARVPVFLGLDHEPEERTGKGTDAEFVLAWRHVHDRFRADGVTNAVWVWTVTGAARYADRYPGLYPGDGYVDWIGYDPYNFFRCRGDGAWRSPRDTIGEFYRWLDAHPLGTGKPRMLAEYGTDLDPDRPGAKRSWLADLPAVVRAYPRLKALAYFNAPGVTTTGAGCDMTLDDSPATLAGFVAAGSDPYFNQPRR